jgi:hypothetical protein
MMMIRRASRRRSCGSFLRITAKASGVVAAGILGSLFLGFLGGAVACVGMPVHLSLAQAEYVGIITLVMAAFGAGVGIAAGFLMVQEI